MPEQALTAVGRSVTGCIAWPKTVCMGVIWLLDLPCDCFGSRLLFGIHAVFRFLHGNWSVARKRLIN